MTENQVLYLLSSTAEPYIKDILDILTLPSNSDYRFRYEFLWLPKDFQTQENLNALKKKEAILVHVHSKRVEKDGQVSFPILEFIPVRKAIIQDAKIMGGFVLFNFKLSDYVSYARPFQDGDKTNPYHGQLSLKVPEDSRKVVNKLAFLSESIDTAWIKDDIATQTDEAMINWSNLVSFIGRLEPHKCLRSVFTKLLEITNINGESRITHEDLSNELYGFRLSGASTYRIKILQRYLYQEKIAPSFKLEITTNSGDISLIKGQALVQGSYDVLDYIISVANVITERESFLYIRPDEVGDKSFMISSSLHFVRIVPQTRKAAAIFGVIILGIILAGISSPIADATKISYLAPVLSLSGAIISAVSAPFFPKS